MIFKLVNLGLRAIGHHTETTEVRDESWKLWCLLLDLAMPEAESICGIIIETSFRGRDF